jgi:hypothetical protein
MGYTILPVVNIHDANPEFDAENPEIKVIEVEIP